MNDTFKFHNRAIVGQVIFTGILALIVLVHLYVALENTLNYFIDSLGNGSWAIHWLFLSIFLAILAIVFVIGCCYYLFAKHIIEIRENEILKKTQFMFFKKISSCRKESIKRVLSIREGVDEEGPDSFRRYALLLDTSNLYHLIGEQKLDVINNLGKIIAKWAGVEFTELEEKKFNYETEWKKI